MDLAHLAAGPGDWSAYDELDTASTFDRAAYEAAHFMEPDVRRMSASMLAFLLFIPILCLIAVYLLGLIHYGFRFYPDTWADGRDVSGMSSGDVQRMFEADYEDYSLRVILRDGEFTLTLDDVGGRIALDPSPANAIASQDTTLWPIAILGSHEHSFAASMEYNDMLALNAIASGFNSLAQPKGEAAKEPSFKLLDDGHMEYVPGTASTVRDPERARALVLEALSRLDSEIDLTGTDAYEDAEADWSSGVVLERAVAAWNACRDVDLAYTAHDGTPVTLDSEELVCNMRIRDGVVEVSDGYLYDLVLGWSGADDMQDVVLYKYGIPVADGFRGVLWDSVLLSRVDELRSDIEQHVPSMFGPLVLPFDLSSGLYLVADLGSGQLVVYDGGSPVASSPIPNTASVAKGGSRACGVSIGRTSVRLSDGTVFDAPEVLNVVGDRPVAYCAVVAAGDCEADAWGLQYPPDAGLSAVENAWTAIYPLVG